MNPSQTITPTQLHKALASQNPPFLLDVREPDEYQEGHLPNSINLPVTAVIAGVMDHTLPKNKLIVTICSHGNRSARMQKLLAERGFNATSLTGGVQDYLQQNGANFIKTGKTP
jgi:rhodanese-related sulfurtransferase